MGWGSPDGEPVACATLTLPTLPIPTCIWGAGWGRGPGVADSWVEGPAEFEATYCAEEETEQTDALRTPSLR